MLLSAGNFKNLINKAFIALVIISSFTKCAPKTDNDDLLLLGILYLAGNPGGCVGASGFSLNSTPQNSDTIKYKEGELIFEFDQSVSVTKAQSMASNSSAKVQSIKGNIRDNSDWNGRLLVRYKDESEAKAVMARMNRTPGVLNVQRNYIYKATALPNDPAFATDKYMWGLVNNGDTFSVTDSHLGTATNVTPSGAWDINAESAWNTSSDCSSITVAVLDTGINYNHEDLTNNMWNGASCVDQDGNALDSCVSGYDFVDNDKNPMDLNGHGTHVAGTIGAEGNNATGGVGVCWSSNLMAVRVLDKNGSGNSYDIADGIDFAVKNGAKVINASWGGYGYDTLIYGAIVRAKNSDVIFVAAAGNETNDNDTTPAYPATYDIKNIISVAAMDTDGTMASFTNYGRKNVDLAAPGTYIYSTVPFTTTASPDDFTSWTKAGNWYKTTIPCSFSSLPYTDFALANDGGTDWCTAWNASGNLPDYAINSSDTAYSTFDMSGAANAKVRYLLHLDAEYGYDILYTGFNSTGGSPYFGVNAIGAYSGSTEGGFYEREESLSSCLTSTCSFGFNFYSDDTVVGDGTAITYFDWVKQVVATSSFEYEFEQGTSMAAPHVSGVAALVWAQNPNASYLDVTKTIFATVTPSNVSGGFSDTTCTGGVVNLKGAMDAITNL